MSEKKYIYGHPMFYRILDKAAEVHNEKNRQYATIEDPLGNFRRCASIVDKLINPKVNNKPLAICLQFMSKQVDGAVEILGEGKKDTVDSLEDKLMDILVYSGIAIILLREGKV